MSETIRREKLDIKDWLPNITYRACSFNNDSVLDKTVVGVPSNAPTINCIFIGKPIEFIFNTDEDVYRFINCSLPTESELNLSCIPTNTEKDYMGQLWNHIHEHYNQGYIKKKWGIHHDYGWLIDEHVNYSNTFYERRYDLEDLPWCPSDKKVYEVPKLMFDFTEDQIDGLEIVEITHWDTFICMA